MEHGPNRPAAQSERVAADPARARRYRQAAVLYFAYGVLYLARVIALGERSEWNLHGYPKLFGFIMLAVGLAITVTFPIFIWRGVRWFTMALAVVVFVRSVYLFVQPNTGFFFGPFVVAAVTAWALARAAWDL